MSELTPNYLMEIPRLERDTLAHPNKSARAPAKFS